MNNIIPFISSFDCNSSTVPFELRQNLMTMSKTVTSKNDAVAALDVLTPDLLKYLLDEEVLLAVGMLMEKTGDADTLPTVWLEIFNKLPKHPLATRMAMRWHYRKNDIDSGLHILRQSFTQALFDPIQAETYLFGLNELQLFSDADSFVMEFLTKFPEDTKIRTRYIQSLYKQERFKEALNVFEHNIGPKKWSPSIIKLLPSLREKSITQVNSRVKYKEALGDLASVYKNRIVSNTVSNPSQQVCLYSGQLGAGGAERQMTRLATMLKSNYDAHPNASEHNADCQPYVCVKQANSKTNSDFFLPVLEDAGVHVEILQDMDSVNINDITTDQKLAELLESVNNDLLSSILKLTKSFKERNVQCAYLWQDGGVLIGAVAALLAEVPMIILNFRGMPPIQRPELLRGEMHHLYTQLKAIPGIEFSCNSKIAARAYCDWLDMDESRFTVIPNAVPELSPKGTDRDQYVWNEILCNSEQATKTVLGVFRFDDNKRPHYWIEMANEYSKKHPETRFVIVGKGKRLESSRKLIAELGAENRIFLAGPSTSVGYWYSKAILVMHLSRMEGLPNVLIESQIAGCAVISTPAGGTPEVVEHGETGYILKCAHNPCSQEIQDTLEKMLSDIPQLRFIGSRAKETSKPRHELDAVLSQTLSLFGKNIIALNQIAI